MIFFLMVALTSPALVLMLWAIYWKRYKQFASAAAYAFTIIWLGQAYISFCKHQIGLMWLHLVIWAGFASFACYAFQQLVKSGKI